MSLFADGRYQWRETYFVLFESKHRPLAADVKRVLGELGPRIEIHEMAASDHGKLESMTVLSHADAAGIIFSKLAHASLDVTIAAAKNGHLQARMRSRKRTARPCRARCPVQIAAVSA